jgi:hypothetical protein
MNQDIQNDGPDGGDPIRSRPLPIPLSRAAFRRFDQWMDQQLAILVAKWAPFAAPAASRPRTMPRRRKLRRRKRR